MIPPPRPRRIGSAGARSKPALSRARAEIRALRAEGHHNDARSDRIVALRHSSEQAIVDSQRLVNSAIELQQQTRSGRTRRERTLRERTVSKRHRP